MSAPKALPAAFGDTRTLTLFNIHTKETTSVLFKKGGKVVPGAYEKLNWALRDWRANEATTIDPALFDLLWDIYTELGSTEPIHVVSAYRSRATNNMLRATVGGQASESRHILGQAIDVHFPDVDIKKLRYSALIRERGGVGYYPTSALPFVHIDTGRVRHWPRLPRHELALLFPTGSSQHQPSDGGPITPEDVKLARIRHRDLSTELAAYHAFRRTPKRPIAVADAAAVAPGVASRPPARSQGAAPAVVATAPALALLEAPRIVDRPSRFTIPSASDRTRLAALSEAAKSLPEPRLLAAPKPATRPSGRPVDLAASAFAPGPVSALTTHQDPASTAPTATLSAGSGPGQTFALAPAFDDDHPDELSYRPFPIAPWLTTTASPDDPVLARLQHPNLAKTLELLDHAGSLPPMRLRPNPRTAALMLAQQFTGVAVSPGTFRDPDIGTDNGVPSRRVATAR